MAFPDVIPTSAQQATQLFLNNAIAAGYGSLLSDDRTSNLEQVADALLVQLPSSRGAIASPPASYTLNPVVGSATSVIGEMTGAHYVIAEYSAIGTATVTTRTALQLIADGQYHVGDSYLVALANSSSGTMTVAGGVGVTITGTATLATMTTRLFCVRIVSATAVTFQSVNVGGAVQTSIQEPFFTGRADQTLMDTEPVENPAYTSATAMGSVPSHIGVWQTLPHPSPTNDGNPVNEALTTLITPGRTGTGKALRCIYSGTSGDAPTWLREYGTPADPSLITNIRVYFRYNVPNDTPTSTYPIKLQELGLDGHGIGRMQFQMATTNIFAWFYASFGIGGAADLWQACAPFPRDLFDNAYHRFTFSCKPSTPMPGTLFIDHTTGNGTFSVSPGTALHVGDRVAVNGYNSTNSTMTVDSYDGNVSAHFVRDIDSGFSGDWTVDYNNGLYCLHPDGWARMWVDGTRIIDISSSAVGVTPPGGVKAFTPFLQNIFTLPVGSSAADAAFGSFAFGSSPAFSLDVDDYQRWSAQLP